MPQIDFKIIPCCHLGLKSPVVRWNLAFGVRLHLAWRQLLAVTLLELCGSSIWRENPVLRTGGDSDGAHFSDSCWCCWVTSVGLGWRLSSTREITVVSCPRHLAACETHLSRAVPRLLTSLTCWHWRTACCRDLSVLQAVPLAGRVCHLAYLLQRPLPLSYW